MGYNNNSASLSGAGAMPNNLRITKFKNYWIKDAYHHKPSLKYFFDKVRNGEWRQEVEDVRRLKAQGDIAGHKAAKENLPGFVMSGQCDTRKEGDFHHNGILCIDLDGKDNPDLSVDEMRERVGKFNFIYGWFVSPSGDGLKVMVKILPSESRHKQSFLTAERVFKDSGLIVDKSGKDIRRLCFASYDPGAVLRDWDEVEVLHIEWGIEGIESIEVIDEKIPLVSQRVSIMADKEAAFELLQRKECDAEAELKKNKKLSNLYFKHLAPYVKKRDAYAGKRNEVLIDIITFLFQAVGDKYVTPLAMAFYDLNQSKFSGNTSRGEHEQEALAHFNNTKEKWFDNLSDKEFSIIEKLPTPHSVTAFRICRSLASLDKPDSPFGQLYLGQTDLSRRIGCGNNSVMIALNTLKEHEVLNVIEKGGRYSEGGERAKATTYNWLLVDDLRQDEVIRNSSEDAA
jgi:hypothetical protein